MVVVVVEGEARMETGHEKVGGGPSAGAGAGAGVMMG